jgi:hypothetical protein
MFKSLVLLFCILIVKAFIWIKERFWLIIVFAVLATIVFSLIYWNEAIESWAKSQPIR